MSRHFGFMVLVGLLALFCAGPASAQIAPAYYVTNIGQLPNGVLGSGIGNFGYAMSNSGNYVTGIGLYPWNPANGFNQGMGYYYNGSTVSPLASTVLSGWANNYEWPGVPVWNPNQPNGVNNSGIVVGQYNNSAFYSLQGGAPVTIPGFPDGVGPMAYSINDNGLIVGDWDTQNNGGYAGFMYNLNTNTLTQLPGFAAFSVNDKGEMAGCGGGGIDTGPAGRNGNPASYGYGEWRDAGGNLYTIPTMMQATAIDSSGTYICGQGSDASASPTLYNTVTGTTVQVAPGTGSWICSALGVNSSGVVVGSMSPVIAPNPLSPQWFTNAFVYAGGTSEYIGNLTLGGAPSGIVWTAATAINDAGQMLVQGALTGAPYGSPVSATCILTPALPGDANLDGTVDINDLTIVLAHYGQTGMTWSQGEFTGDGTVDINDLTIVLANYNKSAGASAGMAAVPEPSCLVLLGIGGVGWLACAGRKRKQRSA